MPLALTRKVGEKVIIGHDIVVQVSDIFQGKVKLLFTAPDSISINREEVYLEIHRPKNKETDKS